MKPSEHSIITIRKESIDQANKAFQDFMSLAELEINQRAKEDPLSFRNATPRGVENLSLKVLQDIAPQTPFRANKIVLNKAQFFPDILAEQYYGVEVKCTKEDHWTSTGSSIIESTRADLVESIYMLFGKLGGACPEFRCKPYEHCLVNIAVTHSPRYLINMNIDPSETIFAKMGVNYDEFRVSSSSIEQVRQYYRRRALEAGKQEMPWWIGSEAEGNTTSVVLRLWSDLTDEEKKKLRAYIFLLFPEVLRSEYKSVALWLCTRFSVLLHNARDAFSASGQYKKVDGKLLSRPIPHIIGELIHSAAIIKEILADIPEEIKSDVALYRAELLGGNPLEEWLTLVRREVVALINKNKLPKDFPFDKHFEEESQLSIK